MYKRQKEDNPKGLYKQNTSFLMTGLRDMILNQHLSEDEIWEEGQEKSLWNAKLYPVCNSMEEAVSEAWNVYQIAAGRALDKKIREWIAKERLSLYSS